MKHLGKTLSIVAVFLLIIACVTIRAQQSPDNPVVIENIDIEDITDNAKDSTTIDMFEQAVAIIKKYEGLHHAKNWPLVGYGHKVQPGERFSRATLSETKAEELLRKDLLKNCAVFREFGADSLLLGTLAYNIGSGNVKRSQVTRELRNGNRDIRELYLRHCRYRGKTLSQLQRRRIEEFDMLFIKNPVDSVNNKSQVAS